MLISRNANRRYFSGFQLGDAEGPTSGWSGTLLVTSDETLIFADSRYVEQAADQAPGWELVATAGRDPRPSCRRCSSGTVSRRSAWSRG